MKGSAPHSVPAQAVISLFVDRTTSPTVTSVNSTASAYGFSFPSSFCQFLSLLLSSPPMLLCCCCRGSVTAGHFVNYRFCNLLLAGCLFVCWLLAYLTSQQHGSVSQGQICSDNITSYHTEIEVADPTFHLTLSQCTDTRPTNPSTDPITPGTWQGSHWSANFLSHRYDLTRKNPGASGVQIPDLPLSRRTP